MKSAPGARSPRSWARSRRCCPTCSAAARTARVVAPADAATAHRTNNLFHSESTRPRGDAGPFSCKLWRLHAILCPRCEPASANQMREESMRFQMSLMCTAAALAFTAANAATTYDGNGQVPQQFVLSGKAADRLHDHISINADTAEKLSKA